MPSLRITETTTALTISAVAVLAGWGKGVDTSALAALCSDPAAFGPFFSDPLGILLWIISATSVFALLSDWGLMLAAMMPLLLVAPLRYVRRCSAPRARAAQSCGFVIGYALIWIAALPLFLVATLSLRSLTGGGVSLIVVLAAALMWSASPYQRYVLNRAHRSPRISLRGWRGFGDTLRFGLSHGALCLCACWAWMLVPMMTGPGQLHVIAMILVSAVIVTERMTQNGPTVWRRPVVLARSAWWRSFNTVRFGVRHA